MISITKDEKEAILASAPGTKIVRTMKHKSGRHHYWCEETRDVMRILNRTRHTDNKSGGDRNRNRKKTR